MATEITVFFIWQSDHARTYRAAWKALKQAVKALNSATTGEFIFAADRDTRGVSGAVPIDHVILEKIRRADVVVADLSPVAQIVVNGREKSLPNPNVMFEVGYAREAVGLERIILFRDAREPWHPPFDIQQLRMLTFETAGAFQKELVAILPAMVAMPSPMGLSAEKSEKLYRVIHSGPNAQSNPQLRSDIALELDLLSSTADDTFARLAERFRTERPWDRPGWPMSTSVHTHLHELLSKAVHPNLQRDDRFTAWSRLGDLMRMVPLHHDRLELVKGADKAGWRSGTKPELGELEDWLDKARLVGCDIDAMGNLIALVSNSLTKNTSPLTDQLRQVVDDFENESPELLLERVNSIRNDE